MLKRSISKAILVTLLALCASMAAAQPDVDLLFCIDGSGSVGSGGLQAQLDATAAAIEECMPHDGSVRVTVLVFDDDVILHPNGMQSIPPVTINAGNAANVASAVTGLVYQGGGSNMTACIEQGAAWLQTLPDPAPRQVIDVSSDGFPSNPAAALLATDNAIAEGIEQINTIATETGGVNETFLEDLAVIHGNGFYLGLNDGPYHARMCAKVAREVDRCMTVETDVVCPTDGSTTFDVSLTFTNMLPVPLDPAESNVVIEAFLQNIPPNFTVSPNYFNFAGNPICSTTDPTCTNSTATIDFTVTYTGPLPVPSTMELWLAIHPDQGACCVEPVEIDLLANCGCGQVFDQQTRCQFTLPFTWQHTFTFQNLFSEEVNIIKLSPITPPAPGIVFNPNIYQGLSLEPPPPFGTGPGVVTLSTVISGPSAQPGQEVCYRIRTERFDDDGGIVPCCSLENCITLPRCKKWPWPWPVEAATLSHEKERWVLTGLDDGKSGVRFDLEKANGFFIHWEALDVVSSSAGLTLTTFSGERPFATATARDDRGSVSLSVDVPAGAVRQIDLYRDGRLVGTLPADTGVTADRWPAGIVAVDPSGTSAFVWQEAAKISGVLADQAAFIVEGEAAEAFTGAELLASGVESIAFEAYATGSADGVDADDPKGGEK